MSWLDSWLEFLDDDCPWHEEGCPPTCNWIATPEDLEIQLRGRFQPTREMKIGTEFHSALELFLVGENEGDEELLYGPHMEHRFDFAEVDVTLPIGATLEVRRDAEVAPGVVLTGKPDAVLRDVIYDWKSTWSTPDIDRYHDSMQWRAYLELVPEANDFEYFIFQVADPLKRQAEDIIRVRRVATYRQHRYEGMAKEVRDTACELATWMESRGLEGYAG